MTLVKRNRDDQQHANAFDLQNNTCLYQNLPRIFDKSKLQNCPYDDKIQRLALGCHKPQTEQGTGRRRRSLNLYQTLVFLLRELK